MAIGAVVILALLGIGIALGVRSCSSGTSTTDSDGAVSGQAATRPTDPSSTVGAVASPLTRPTSQPALRLVLSLSANGAMECQAYAGWPITLLAIVSHPNRFGGEAPAIKLGATDRPWSGGLRLEVKDAGGKAIQFPSKLTRVEPAGGLQLSGESTGRAMWQIAADDSARIAPGVYAVRAVLESDAAPRLESRPVMVRIAAEPAQLSADEKARKQRLFAVDALWRKDFAAAEKRVDELLGERPDDIAGWEIKGDLLRAQNKPQAAVAAYDSALAAFRKIAKDEYDEPSRSLMAKRRQVIEQLVQPK